MSSLWTIRRSTTDAKFAGVCGGVARHWNVDPVLVRVGCVLLALSGGIGLVLYVAGWLLIPAEGKDKPVINDLLGEQANRLSREMWIVIVVLACIVSFTLLGSITPFGFGPAVVLALIWYFGYYRTKVRTSPAPPPGPGATTPPAVQQPEPTQFYSYSGPPTAFTQAADAWRERVIQVEREAASRDQRDQPADTAAFPRADQAWAAVPKGPVEEDRSEPSGWAQPPAPEDRQAFLAHPDPVGLYSPAPVVPAKPVKAGDRASARRLRLIGLIVLGVTLTGLALADASGVAVPAAAYLATALLVIGLVLIAATWFGRARGLLPVGILVAIATAIATAVPQLPAPTQWQPHTVTYSSVADLPAGGDQLDTGALNVDLSGLKLTKDATYTAEVDVGALTVTVPENVNVVIDYSIDAGSITSFGEPAVSGSDLKAVIPARNPTPDQPTLTLKLSADLGQIEVKR